MIKKSFIIVLTRIRILPFVRRFKELITSYSAESIQRQSELKSFYAGFINTGDLCFDVGANMGNRTRIFLRLGARVVCIEPQEQCFRQLSKKYKTSTKVILVQQAVGEKAGFADLSICDQAPTISTMSVRWKTEGRFSTDYQWERSERVEVSTLDELITQYGLPKFCKIDVEGFEHSVLMGLSQSIPNLSFEYMSEFFDDTKRCIHQLSSIAEYRYNCTKGESMEFILPDWVTAEEFCKVIDSPGFGVNWGDVYARLE